MYPFPKVAVRVTPQYQVVNRFLSSEFWDPQYDALFTDDITVDFPYAPPGMYQHMIPFEFRAYRFWLSQTVRTHELTGAPTVIPTTDPNLFWTIHEVRENVYWGKRETEFVCEFASRITLRGDQICDLRMYANPVSYYDAMGVILPNFNYLLDCQEDAPMTRMEVGQVSHFTREENVRRAVANFANPIDGHDDDPEPIYANDMVEVTPFAPKDMLTVWRGKDFDIQTEWMFRTVPEWNTIEEIPFYQSEDPAVIIVESYGYGRTCWSNHDGHYTQRELQIVHLDDTGKIDHFRVYFNCVNKFSSLNQSLPTFPYYNY